MSVFTKPLETRKIALWLVAINPKADKNSDPKSETKGKRVIFSLIFT
jgi:hypothetical protein